MTGIQAEVPLREMADYALQLRQMTQGEGVFRITPALYQQLFLLLNKFPGDIARFRLALTLIIAHQRLRDAPVPVNDDLSAFHRQLRRTADHVISAVSDDKRRRYFARLLEELDVYQEKLQVWEASPQVTEPVRRLVEMLRKYQHVLTNS